MKRWMAVLVAVPAVLIASATAYFVRDAHRKAQAVEELCRSEGGLHIYKTAYASGYLDARAKGDYPELYIQELVAKKFEYVDFVQRAPGNRYPELKVPGYFRVSIEAISDARCVYRYGESLPGRPSAAQERVPPGRCLALHRILEIPEHYEYSFGFRRITAPNNVIVGAREQVIKHWPSGEILGRDTNFIASTKFSDLLEMSGGVSPDYACAINVSTGTTADQFLTAVLRDWKQSSGVH